ncbi:MAG: membrane protein insertase YidC [Actinomycetaceae bacterium]|nr:membrane protein insertase YidC [Actinomycetaceae bacterium]
MSLFAVSFYDRMLYIFNYAVAWIMVRLHDLLVFFGMKEGPNFAWVLAIIGLTLVVRSAIIPLYAKQIRSQRAMQEIQPKMQEIKDKYKGRKDQVSQQQMNQQIMELYREHGVNPLASCLPLLIQMPFIIALYRVLLNTVEIARGRYGADSIGPIDQTVAQEIEKTEFIGIPLSTTFSDASAKGETTWIAIIIGIAVITAIIMFSSMWLLSVKNLPKNASDQNAKMMRMMAFLGPVMTLMFSFAVQMGVLVYWLITNIFTAVQQMVILQKAPTVGSPAHDRFLMKAHKKLDVFQSSAEEHYRERIEELGLKEHDVNSAKSAIMKAESKVEQDDCEPAKLSASAKFKSARSLRKQALIQQLSTLEARKTRERLGEKDPFINDEDADKIHEAVSLRRQLDARVKNKRIELGIDRPPLQAKKKKKGYFARKMEEAAQIQQQQRGGQRSGQRVQPSKKTRAQRLEEAKGHKQRKNTSVQLTPEEIEKRRQERRKQARNKAKKRRGK